MEDVYRSMLAAEVAAVSSRNPTVTNAGAPRARAAHAWGTVAAESAPKPKPRAHQGGNGESVLLSTSGQRADARILTSRLLGNTPDVHKPDSMPDAHSTEQFSSEFREGGLTSALIDRYSSAGGRLPTEAKDHSTTITHHR
jgi:hypothetical protein